MRETGVSRVRSMLPGLLPQEARWGSAAGSRGGVLRRSPGAGAETAEGAGGGAGLLAGPSGIAPLGFGGAVLGVVVVRVARFLGPRGGASRARVGPCGGALLGVRDCAG